MSRIKIEVANLLANIDDLPFSLPPTQVGGTSVEVANLPSTPLTKFAMFMIAHGLIHKAKDANQSTDISKALVRKVEAIFDPSSLEKYGIKMSIFKQVMKHDSWFAYHSDYLKRFIAQKIVNDNTISKDEVDVVKAAALFLQDPNDSRTARIRKIASKLSIKFGDNVTKVLGAESENEEEISDKVEELTSKLNAIVKKMTGKAGVKVPMDVLKAPKNINNKATYNQLRREIGNLYDEQLNHFLAGQKNDTAYVHEAYKHMESLGFPVHKLPVFNKKVPLKITRNAGKTQYLTESGKPIAGSIPPGATKITFMKTYDEETGKGAYLSYTAPEAVSTTRVYTEQHKKQAAVSKFGKADLVTENIGSYLTKWRKDLLSRDEYKRMGATVAMLVYETGMRAGTRQRSAASATGVATYGALSLRPRHVRVSTTSIIIKYEGKKAVQQEHKIMLRDKWDKLLAKNLKEFLEDKTRDDLVFSFFNERGTEKPLSPARMTQYLSSTGYTVGLHKLRHVKGTNLVVELLNKLTFKPTAIQNRSLASKQKAAEEWMKKKILEPVAALLGHKNKDKLAWRTSIGSYINPAPIIKFFDDNNLRKPNWVPNKLEE